MSIPCKGNGMTLGLTDGTYNYGIIRPSTDGLGSRNNSYDKNLPFNDQSGTTTAQAGTAFGITTDPTKSGVVADLSDGQIVVIKY